MTADPFPRADRVRKVRWAARLACGHFVQVGHVAVRRGGRWVCRECALAEVKTIIEGKRP